RRNVPRTLVDPRHIRSRVPVSTPLLPRAVRLASLTSHARDALVLGSRGTRARSSAATAAVDLQPGSWPVIALLAALSLQLAPAPARSPALSLEGNITGIFASDGEAVNFSAHTAWSIAAPLTGQALFGRAGLWGAGGTWIAYSLVNEFALHGPEGE